MRLTDLQRAMIVNALGTLEQDPTYDHPPAVIRRIAGVDALRAIQRLKKDLLEANKTYQGSLALSADAQAYDMEVRQLITLGKRAQHSANRSLEKRVSQMSESLEERFEERVPEEDRPKFLESDGDGRSWDDRWSFMEFRPPLLRPEYTGRPFEHPMNIAQRTVLADLASADDVQATDSARTRLKSALKLVRSGE